MNIWILGARPRTLPAAIAPVVVAVAIAHPTFNSINALLALIVGLSLQIAVNYANDYSDGIKGTDEVRVGPTRLVASGLASASAVKEAAIVAFAIGAAAGLYLAIRTSYWLIAIGAAAIVAGWRYTGGKNPYGYRGLGEVFVFIFFGLVATIGTFYGQTGTITLESVLAAISNGAVACALLAVNNIRDIEGDSKVGKQTLAVRLGDVRARRFYMFLIFIAIFTAFTISIISVIAVIPAIGLLKAIQYKKGRELIEVLGATGKFQLILGALISVGALVNI
jgi:1,4-dihydroxy-2-naphthoate octaprenyltransferase